MRNVASGSDVANGTSKQSASVQDYEQPRYSQRDIILTMAGVLMVMLLASLDQTSPLLQIPKKGYSFLGILW